MIKSIRLKDFRTHSDTEIQFGEKITIITGSSGRAQEKIEALVEAGAIIPPSPAEIGLTVKNFMESKFG